MRALKAVSLCCLAALTLSEKPPEVEIVLARCREDISWVDQMGYSDITTVYDKCGMTEGPGHHVEMANVGREGGTYLQHIVDRYDTLADWTVFSQAGEPSYGYRGHRLGGGHMMSNVKFSDYVDAAKTRAEIPRFFMYTTILMMKDRRIFQCIRRGYGDQYTKPETDDFRTKMCGKPDDWTQWDEFPDWFTGLVTRLQDQQNAPFKSFDTDATLRMWDIWPTNGVTFFAQGARFALSKEAIQMRPKSYYESLLPHFNHPDPWAGYFMEWLWWYVLAGEDAPCQFENHVVDHFAGWLNAPKTREVVIQQVTSGAPQTPVNNVTDCASTPAGCTNIVVTVNVSLAEPTRTAPVVFAEATITASLIVSTPSAPVQLTGMTFNGGPGVVSTLVGLTLQLVNVLVQAVLQLQGPTTLQGTLTIGAGATVEITGNLNPAGATIQLTVGAVLSFASGESDFSQGKFKGKGAKLKMKGSKCKYISTEDFELDLETESSSGQGNKFRALQTTGSTVGPICAPVSGAITIASGNTFVLDLTCTSPMKLTNTLTLSSGSTVSIVCPTTSSYTPPSASSLVVPGKLSLVLGCTPPATTTTWNLLTYTSSTVSGASVTVTGCASGCTCTNTFGTTSWSLKQTCGSSSSGGDSGNGTDAGLIIGAVVGSVCGAAFLAIVLGLLYYYFYWSREPEVFTNYGQGGEQQYPQYYPKGNPATPMAYY